VLMVIPSDVPGLGPWCTTATFVLRGRPRHRATTRFSGAKPA
jgi:hypothetical protein